MAPSLTPRRWDVGDGIGGFKGAIITLPPQSVPASAPVDVLGGKLYRVEVRPPSFGATLRWLTVLDPAGAITFTEPAAATSVVIADLAPRAAYTVQVSPGSGSHVVTVSPGSGAASFMTSGAGVLTVKELRQRGAQQRA